MRGTESQVGPEQAGEIANSGQEQQNFNNAAGMAFTSNADLSQNVDPAIDLNFSMNVNPADAGLVPMPDGIMNQAMYPPVPPSGISSGSFYAVWLYCCH